MGGWAGQAENKGKGGLDMGLCVSSLVLLREEKDQFQLSPCPGRMGPPHLSSTFPKLLFTKTALGNDQAPHYATGQPSRLPIQASDPDSLSSDFLLSI